MDVGSDVLSDGHQRQRDARAQHEGAEQERADHGRGLLLQCRGQQLGGVDEGGRRVGDQVGGRAEGQGVGEGRSGVVVQPLCRVWGWVESDLDRSGLVGIGVSLFFLGWEERGTHRLEGQGRMPGSGRRVRPGCVWERGCHGGRGEEQGGEEGEEELG